MRIDFAVRRRRSRPSTLRDRVRAGRRAVRDDATSCGTPQAPYRTLILVSKQLHCLNDLLFRQSTGALQIEIPAVVSNHPDAEPLADVVRRPLPPRRR